MGQPGCSGCPQQKLTLDESKKDFMSRLNGKTGDLALKQAGTRELVRGGGGRGAGEVASQQSAGPVHSDKCSGCSLSSEPDRGHLSASRLRGGRARPACPQVKYILAGRLKCCPEGEWSGCPGPWQSPLETPVWLESLAHVWCHSIGSISRTDCPSPKLPNDRGLLHVPPLAGGFGL